LRTFLALWSLIVTHGIRTEFEGLVAISDPEETKNLLKLVEHSTIFIRRLPWANGECMDNDGKGPFEKTLFEPPDFASIHGMYLLTQWNYQLIRKMR
jgi:dipeptidyl-peptidase-3